MNMNSNTTGHSRSKDISFSKKLFIGLGIAIVAAVAFFLLIGQRKELSMNNPKPISTSEETGKSGETGDGATPTPVSEQPKN